MKILLANPPCRIDLKNGFEKAFVRAGSRWPFSTIVRKGKLLEYLPFPFYLAYTAALLEKEGFEILVNDALTLNQSLNDFMEKTVIQKPDIILYETSTPTINYDLSLAKNLKKQLPAVIICLAGPHVTIFSQEILKENPFIDFVFLQEYEVSFSELMKKFKNGESFAKISGLGFRVKGSIKINQPQLIDSLDQLPFPARHLFPSNEKPEPTVYWDGFCQYKPAVQMHATRGCPFRCNFCLWNQVMYRNGKYRMFSPKRVVDEMAEVIKKYKAREIYFDDDTFTANKEHVLNICREITNRGLRITWSVMGDAMVTDREMVEAMADAGCIGIKFGVESGNKEILKHIQKPVNFEKLKDFTNWCTKRKIKTHATFTFGLSGETKQTMQETLDLAKSLDVDSVQFSITTPFPGTRYYEEVKKEGLLVAKNWQDFDGASKSIVKFKGLKTSEVVKFCQKASGRWLRIKLKNPSWISRQVFNGYRLIKGQGLGVLFKRLKRVLELFFT